MDTAIPTHKLDRVDDATLSALKTAVREHASRKSQTAKSAAEGERTNQEAAGRNRAGRSDVQRHAKGKLEPGHSRRT